MAVSKRLIFLVDDNKATNFFNKHQLKKMGIDAKIELFSNGKDALEHIQSSSFPDLIFLDINMPIMSGIDFIKAAQQLKDFNNGRTRIVVLLGSGLEPEILKEILKFRNVSSLNGKMLTAEMINKALTICQQSPTNTQFN